MKETWSIMHNTGRKLTASSSPAVVRRIELLEADAIHSFIHFNSVSMAHIHIIYSNTVKRSRKVIQ